MSSPVRTGIGPHILRGAIWMIAMRWLMRSIGLINTIVLARILSPDDFGIMAMSGLVIEFLMMLGDTSVDLALLRESDQSREVYDSAWTLQVVFGVGVGILVVLVTPLLVTYYRDPRIASVTYIMALRPVISGFENVGVVEFRKSLDFAKEFRYWIFRRLSLLIFSLILALLLRNYLALAIAAPISAAVGVAFSFIMSTYRPKFTFAKARIIWAASRWFILQSLADTALDRTDEFIIGGTSTSTSVGYYYIAAQVAPMPTRELAWPVERALMPAYTKITSTPDDLRQAFISVMGIMGLICFPAGAGIAVVADDLVRTVFGNAWEASVPLFRWLAVFGIVSGLARPLMPLFYALRRERLYALIAVLQVAMTAPVLVFAAIRFDLVAVAAGRTIVAIGFFGILCAYAVRLSQQSLLQILRVLWRSATAAALMATTVRYFHDNAIAWPIVSLLRDCCIGAIVFILLQYLLWLCVGRPEGPEAVVLRKIRGLQG